VREIGRERNGEEKSERREEGGRRGMDGLLQPNITQIFNLLSDKPELI
jgi:hypothetical protein